MSPAITKIKKATEVAISDQKRPLIGIVGHMLGPNSVGVTFPYLNYFENFGNVKLIMPSSKELDTSLDLLVIPGGPDIDPARYLDAGDRPSWANQKPDPMREYFDTQMLPHYIDKRTPIFGINDMSHSAVM